MVAAIISLKMQFKHKKMIKLANRKVLLNIERWGILIMQTKEQEVCCDGLYINPALFMICN